MLVTKCACQATSMMKRTFKRVSSLVPQNVSTTYNFVAEESCFVTKSLQWSNTSGVVGRLIVPSHHKCSSETASLTKNLSLGERPVNLPVSTDIAPELVNTCLLYTSDA